ncbi:Protein of unknown function [Paenibacillus uliginis N3/975]|uniref:DUF3397 domain-containing protein n=1 Tax=Paenibacillus uliginis N3/975 TaxID=1313296 RepID=A0A1X7HMB1_9BACL|nr:DUF3397 domain-containing protein [Paenibacillus uliginis]SMF88435.1 Protein of unknown function [Paenibacillus uliginis N3/975]
MDLLIIMSVVPVIPFILVYLIVTLRKKDKRQAMKLAMDVTTVFLLISVSALFNNLFQTKFGFYLILLLLLITAGLIGGAQNRWKGRVDGKRLLRVVWRLAFVTMSISYIIFTFFGLVQYIFKVM